MTHQRNGPGCVREPFIYSMTGPRAIYEQSSFKCGLDIQIFISWPTRKLNFDPYRS